MLYAILSFTSEICSLESFENDGDFKANLLADPDVTSRLSTDEIEKLFSKEDFLKNIDKIYNKF